jgi:putative transposase
MPVPRPPMLVVSDRQRAALEQLARAPTAAMGLVQRARLVLAMAAGGNNTRVAAQYQVQVATARLWRGRWLAAAPRLAALEAGGCTDKELRAAVLATLSDAYRCGVPPTFSDEQVIGILKLACTPPEDLDVPISQWTPRDLAQVAIAQGIVPRISPRSVGRFLKGGRVAAASLPLLAHPAGGGPGAL